MLPEEKVQNLIDRHLKLEQELSSGNAEKKLFDPIRLEKTTPKKQPPKTCQYICTQINTLQTYLKNQPTQFSFFI